jgi:hypothetical protein
MFLFLLFHFASCRFSAQNLFKTQIKKQLFFPNKEEKEKKEEKKGYASSKQWSGGCQGFLKK